MRPSAVRCPPLLMSNLGWWVPHVRIGSNADIYFVPTADGFSADRGHPCPRLISVMENWFKSIGGRQATLVSFESAGSLPLTRSS
jgi:hypothetical protein